MVSIRRAGVLACGAAMLIAPAARAQGSAADAAAAQALFDEGKALMQKGQFAEGCPKLAESQRLDPAGGTLLVLGLCHEGEGKTASAWVEFTAAASQARIDRRADRENAANEHVKALEAKLTRMKIVAPDVPGLEIRRDGVLLGRATWTTPIPIDPGDYAFEAKAPGKRTFRDIFPIKGAGQIVEVKIPPLEDDPSANRPPPPVVAPKPAPPPDIREEPPKDGKKNVIPAAIVGVGGLVFVGLGTAFGLSASAKWKDAEKACPAGRCTTTADKKLGEDAGKAADVSTAMFVIGGVAIGAAAVLYVLAPTDDARAKVRATPFVTGDAAGLAIGGRL